MSRPKYKAPRMLMEDGHYVAENATIVEGVQLAFGSSVWYGTVLRGDDAEIIVGRETNIQDNCVLHPDPEEPLVIGDHVTIGHGAMVHCREIEQACLVGIHAIVLGGAHIGEGSIIGAGALVTEGTEIPPRSLVLGVPGKVVRTLDEDILEEHRRIARNYVKKAERHWLRTADQPAGDS